PEFGAQRSRILEARRKQCSFIVTDERQRRRGRSARRLVPIWVLHATRRASRTLSASVSTITAPGPHFEMRAIASPLRVGVAASAALQSSAASGAHRTPQAVAGSLRYASFRE